MVQTKTVNFTVKSTGVDWVTATCSDTSLRRKLEDFMCGLLHEEGQKGNDVTPWKLMQFEGLKSGPVGFGGNDEMAIVRLSREAAQENWRTLLPLTTNVSRIDLQATIEGVSDCIQLIAEHEREALDHVKEWVRKPEVTLRKSNNTGLTLYLNRRTSDHFARCYDKGTESRSEYWAQCARYEVQYQNRAGKQMAASLLRESECEAGIGGRVHAFFAARGCVLPWSPAAIRFNESVPRSQTDSGRRLRWLASQVRPAVERLIEEGRAEEVYEALGLTWSNGERPELDHQIQSRKDKLK